MTLEDFANELSSLIEEGKTHGYVVYTTHTRDGDKLMVGHFHPDNEPDIEVGDVTL